MNNINFKILCRGEIKKRMWVFSILSIFLLIPSCTGLQNRTNTKLSDLTGAELPSNLSINKRFNIADKFYKSGVEKFDAKKWHSSKLDFNYALKILLDSPANEEDSNFIREQNILFSKICLFQIKLNKAIYGVMPDINKNYNEFPIVFNSRIERWLEYYVTSGRKYFGLWLKRSGKYAPWMMEVFRKEGLPEELVFVALVESGFNPYARSPKHAVGMWQFIESTGKICGLNNSHWQDERRNPEKATLAAAKHLKELYSSLGSWELALASYNAGYSRVKKAMARQNTNDFWELILPAETEEYVPKIMATIMIAREPEIYGFSAEFDEVGKTEEIIINGVVDLKTIANSCAVPLLEIVDLNPELTKGCTPSDVAEYALQVPLGTKDKFIVNFNALSPTEKYLSKTEIEKRKIKGRYIVYHVKKGDNLSSIAQKFRTTVSNVKKWNQKARNTYIHPGDKLRIYRQG